MLRRALALCAVLACSEAPGTDRPPSPVTLDASVPTPPFRCTAEAEAPVPDGLTMGGIECIPVGARSPAAPEAWPDAAALASFRAPVRYVSPTAPPGGDGSATSRAFSTLAEALVSLRDGGGTVVLARGRHQVAQPIELRGAVALEGTGALGGSDLVLVGSDWINVRDGAARLHHVAVLRSGGAERPTAPSLQVSSGGSASLEDVRLEGGGLGLLVDGGRVDALRVTIAVFAGDGVRVQGGGSASLVRAWVHHCNRGVVTEDGVAHVRESLLASNGTVGLLLRGRAPGNGAASCTLEGPSREPGPLQCLARVALVGNTTVGLAVTGAPPGESGPVVEARRLAIVDTRAWSTPSGDGVLVVGRAELRVDPEATTEGSRGLGTQVLGNARAGVLVTSGARLSLTGARVAFNGGPGVFVQDSAAASRVSYNHLQRNHGLAIGVTATGAVGELVCNAILETIPATLSTNLGAVPVGDGVSVSGAGLGSPETLVVRKNTVRSNPRFGMVFFGRYTLMLDQLPGTITDNGYPIGVYGPTVRGVGYDPQAQPQRTPAVPRGGP
ncbi:MAG: right-handed parallel beta-helix repeat-containing protein [Deltaproteobacteria bacterium]|nr:right-handed parallel beta-helix repeat-containing protein [Deltaproteobacteria bacterium]